MDERKGKPSASAMARLAACAGSLAMCRNLPDVPTADSDHGTMGHEFLAGRLKAEDLPDDILDTAEACQKIEGRLLAQWKARYAIPEDAEITVTRDTERLWIVDAEGNELCSGVADVVHLWERRALILDWKFLPGVHSDADENLQLRTLAILTMHKHGWLRSADVAIVQPLKSHSPQVCSYGVDDLIAAQTEILAIIEAANKPDAPLNPGEQCRFCRANNGTCPAARKEVETLSMMTINAMGMMLGDDEMAALADRCGPAAKMIGSIKAEVYRRVEANPEKWRQLGFEIREGAGKRAVEDIATVGERLNALGVEWPAITAACSITLTNVEKLTRAATGEKGMGLKKKCDTLLDGCVTVKKSKPSLKKIGTLDEDDA